jgi:membrane carboxypeptidase/penicillin-binding protein
MGITTVTEPDKYGLTLALGTAEVKLQELVNAYSAFANQGAQYQPTIITGIKDKYHNDVYEYKQVAPKQVTTPEASYLITSILSDNNARAPTFGASLNLSNNRKAAVKTGTTNDSKDAWTIGYTPSIVVGAWMGNNENEPMIGLAGSSSAGGVWKNTITNFLGDSPLEDFKKPDSVVSMQVCRGTELKSTTTSVNTREEFFIKGAEPKGECNSKKQENNVEPQNRREEKEEKRDERNKRQESTAPQEPVNTTPVAPAPVPSTGESGGLGGAGEEEVPAPSPQEEPQVDTSGETPN